MKRVFPSIIAASLALLLIPASIQGETEAPTQEASNRPRVLVTTDINNVGADPDDKQSMAHLLMYADELDIVGIIPDRWDARGIEATMEIIDTYARDYASPATRYRQLDFPEPEALRNLVQRDAASGRRHLIEQARLASPADPLYVLVWGKMLTLEDALRAAPDIAERIRVLSIATHVKAPDRADCHEFNWNHQGRNAIFEDPRFQAMWWVESDWTYNAMFVGDAPRELVDRIARYGALGKRIKDVVVGVDKPYIPYPYFRAGDTPTVLYLLDSDHDPDRPDQSSWAGRFTRPFPETRPNYWTGIDAGREWNYAQPCETWQHSEAVYQARVQTLLDERPDMYAALLAKLDRLYPQHRE